MKIIINQKQVEWIYQIFTVNFFTNCYNVVESTVSLSNISFRTWAIKHCMQRYTISTFKFFSYLIHVNVSDPCIWSYSTQVFSRDFLGLKRLSLFLILRTASRKCLGCIGPVSLLFSIMSKATINICIVE